MTTVVFHISDIHIGSSADRIEEYNAAIVEFHRRVNSYITSNSKVPLIVISGDVFHHKNRYNGDDVALFKLLLKGLSNLPVIIIPGNHDTAALMGAAPNELDLISPIVRDYPNVIYSRDSGIIKAEGLTFYHISVFDPISAKEINALDLDDKILLYHGMVNGARFGDFNVSGERIFVDRLRRTRAAMLGDIHAHQVIEERAAYAGSMIQQNFGETNDKGYLVWELPADHKQVPRITHYTLPSINRFVKIDLRGCAPSEVSQIINAAKGGSTDQSRISVIVDDDTQLETATRIMGRVDKVSRVARFTRAASASDPVTDQIETLKNMLSEMHLDTQTIEQILELHRERIKNFEVAKWHINRVTWSNMFKYTSGDIDFDRLAASPGIAGVVAGNMSGKSSIFDIMVWGLFGKYLRGDKRSIVRFGTTLADVSICFTSNGVGYKVERKELGKGKSILTLKRASAPDTYDIDMTAKTMDLTYQRITKLIGGHEQFLSTGLYYDGINDIVKMSGAERRRVFPELFGMTDNTSLVKELKAKIRVLKEQGMRLVRPRQEADPATELEELNTMKSTIEDQMKSMIPIIENARTTKAAGERDLMRYNELSERRVATDKERKRLKARLSGDINTREKPEPCARPRRAISHEVRSSPRYAPHNAVAVNNAIAELERELEELDAALPDELRGNTKSRDELERAIKSKSLNREKVQALLIEAKAELEKVNAAAADIANNIKKHKGAISGDIGAMRYSSSCECCKLNRELTEGGQKLEDQLAIERANMRATLNASEKCNRLNIELARLDAESHETRILALLNEHEAIIIRRAAAESAIKQARERAGLIADVAAHNAWDLQEQYERERDTIIALQSAELMLGVIDEDIRTLDIDNIRKKLKRADAVEKQSGMLADLQEEYSKIVSSISALEKEKVIWDEFNLRNPVIIEELKKTEAYLECVIDEKLQLVIARKHSTRIMLAVNDVLKGITNFTLEVDAEGIFSGLTIVSNAASGPASGAASSAANIAASSAQKLPADMGSGFQKFIISIAFRIAFTTNLYNSPQFLCIDEGFGCMDDTNTAKLGELFAAIRPNFKFVFIITHITELQSIIADPLVITDAPTTISNAPAAAELTHIEMLRALMNAPAAVKDAADTVLCECGAKIKARSAAAHAKTKKHLNAMQAKNAGY